MYRNNRSGYDLLAHQYDNLAGLVFGKPIFDSQIRFLNEVKPGANVLVLGGGSGWILQELRKLNPTCRICYIDSCISMIELAKEANQHQMDVDFICATEMEIPLGTKFDSIITHFYMNTIPNERYDEKLNHIFGFMAEDGVWLMTDFVESSRRKHKILSSWMHVFFKLVTNHPNARLVQWEEIFLKHGLKKRNEDNFFDGFIKAMVFCRKL